MNGKLWLFYVTTHYNEGVGKPSVISLYTEMTSLVKISCGTITDFVIRTETAAAALKNCGKNITDSLLIAMVYNF